MLSGLEITLGKIVELGQRCAFPSATLGKRGYALCSLFWLSRLHTTSDEDDPKIKVFHFDKMNSFHVEDLFILGHINYTFCHAKIYIVSNDEGDGHNIAYFIIMFRK